MYRLVKAETDGNLSVVVIFLVLASVVDSLLEDFVVCEVDVVVAGDVDSSSDMAGESSDVVIVEETLNRAKKLK